MELKSLLILAAYWVITIDAQKSQDFNFPTQFQIPSSGIFASDSSIYLPPEPYTVLPIVAISDSINKHNFPYLPTSKNNALKAYSPISTTSSNLEEFYKDSTYTNNGQETLITQQQAKPLNHTQTNTHKDIGEQKKLNNNEHIQRPFDLKFPQYTDRLRSTPLPLNLTPANRRNIIATEIKVADASVEQMHESPFFGQQLINIPNHFISSTTEPAIPILRLSNEMDLDGSFSYEALGADQTHFVQHSHIENQGSDKEEQVVEGSYSYIGDNGQTYTVHYVADSNGFRATGDHLPVPPPIPEIIQRSIQFNLGEESMRPAHIKASNNIMMNNGDIGNENINSNYNHHAFTVVPPQRNLFTGRNPQAFSISFPQNTNSQNNNIVAVASSTAPSKSNLDIIKENTQIQTNNGQISPQVTFLASQGAYSPNNPIYETISRKYSTEKPSMTQLINYEPNIKDNTDQINKGLWRWQYGINSDRLNIPPNKNTISRSSKNEDEIMINFNDMTQKEYSNIIKHIPDLTEEHDHRNNVFSIKDNEYYQNPQETVHYAIVRKPLDISIPDKNNYFHTDQNKINNHKLSIDNASKAKEQQTNLTSNAVSSNNYSYNVDYEDTLYNSRNVQSVKKNLYLTTTTSSYDNQLHKENNQIQTSKNYENNLSIETSITDKPLNIVTSLTSQNDVLYKPYHKNGFKPTFTGIKTESEKPTTYSVKELLEKNIFLKALLTSNKNEKSMESSDNYQNKIMSTREPQLQLEKAPEFTPLQKESFNNLNLNKKPLHLADVINFALMKNNFESNKLKRKSQSMFSNNKNQERFIASQRDPVRDNTSVDLESSDDNKQLEDKRTVVKNYKVLQRHNAIHNQHNRDNSEIKKEVFQHLDNIYKEDVQPLERVEPSIRDYFRPDYV